MLHCHSADAEMNDIERSSSHVTTGAELTNFDVLPRHTWKAEGRSTWLEMFWVGGMADVPDRAHAANQVADAAARCSI